MSLYDDVKKPIDHVGASEYVTAAELRNCLSKLCECLCCDKEDGEPVPVMATAIGDDGPAPDDDTEPAPAKPTKKTTKKKAAKTESADAVEAVE